ncbi:polyprenal reductase [Chironomus tepperi]|uniref:polyprenal reductase n=1 Tax=Chironomus tepperi TaxID=113505 RepID=UPI00391FB2C6
MDLIKLLFLQLTLVIVLLGSLMNSVEKYLPTYVRKIFRYGKHSYQSENSYDKIVDKIEVPKSWFKHFYIFAVIWSWMGLILAISVYFQNYQPPLLFYKYLDFSCGSNREIEITRLETLTALSLITVQCTRRFIETNFLQIFSKKSKINLTHYFCGFLHYYGIVILIIAKSDGFNTENNQQAHIIDGVKDVFLAFLTTVVFLYLNYKQFETNMIFINLRKLKSGKIMTEHHALPKGGLFKYVSSPHMFTEVGMYVIMYVLLYKNSTYTYCLFWVISNQTCNAILTHKWYVETFKDYPKDRKSIIPFLL